MQRNSTAARENGTNVKKKQLTIILQSVRKCCTNFAIWYEYFGCFEDFMRL